MGSATSDTSMQFGGALGVGVLGTMLNFRFHDLMAPLLAHQPIPAGIEKIILGSLGGALAVAHRLPGKVRRRTGRGGPSGLHLGNGPRIRGGGGGRGGGRCDRPGGTAQPGPAGGLMPGSAPGGSERTAADVTRAARPPRAGRTTAGHVAWVTSPAVTVRRTSAASTAGSAIAPRIRRSYPPAGSDPNTPAKATCPGRSRRRTAVWVPSHGRPAGRISISAPSSSAGVNTTSAPFPPPTSRTTLPSPLGGGSFSACRGRPPVSWAARGRLKPEWGVPRYGKLGR